MTLLRIALRSLAIVGVLSASATFAAQKNTGSLGPISDFMIMDVCVGGDGNILPGVIPGDGACKSHRNIKPGETPPYELQNFLRPGSRCDGGSISKINVPIAKDGSTRIVSSTVRLPSCGGGADDDDDDGSKNGASIQWFDDGYGFIMGSYSPVALSAFESPLCQQNSQSSSRFFRGWVIGPASVPGVGANGYGIFPSKLLTGAASTHMGQCAARYNNAITTWSVNDFTFKSGRQFVSLVASHYARGAANGKSPGEAMQMEQTYWTREFGLSRWEKWAREDWVHPRSKKTALDLAHAMFASGRCSPPMSQSVNFNREMQLPRAEQQPDAYARVIRNAVTGEQHTWYMTLCEDYTNAKATPAQLRGLGKLSGLADDAYWR